MKYQFETQNEITRCCDCPIHFNPVICGINTVELTFESFAIKKPSWCPLVKLEQNTIDINAPGTVFRSSF